MGLVEHDHTIKAFTPDGTDDALSVWVGLRRQMHPMAMNQTDVSRLRIPSIHCTGASLRW